MNLYRRKIANDLVPTELPSKGPNDKHGPKTRPINRLPGSNLPFLQGPSRLPIRVRFKLFKILPLHSRSPNKNLTSSLESLSQYLRRSHRNQSLSHRLRLHLRSPLLIDVKNTGTVDGSHTILVFAAAPNQIWSPEKHLIGFEKVHLIAGSQKRVRMGIHVCDHLSRVDQFGTRRIPTGEHKLHIGDLTHSISLHVDLQDIKF